jgi:hypothetical protein
MVHISLPRGLGHLSSSKHKDKEQSNTFNGDGEKKHNSPPTMAINNPTSSDQKPLILKVYVIKVSMPGQQPQLIVADNIVGTKPGCKRQVWHV